MTSDCPEIAAPKGSVLDELNALLAEERYPELEGRIEAYDAAYSRRIDCEGYVWDVYDNLAVSNTSRREWIDRWVAQRPDARAAHLVRGRLHYNLGFDARGTKFANKTSAEQFSAMRRHFKEAVSDAIASRRLGPVHMVAAGIIVGIAQAGGEPEQGSEWVETLLQAEPLNFGIRWRVVHSHEPRWGGSLEAMEEFVRGAQAHADRNPRLRVLLGFPDAYRAEMAAKKDDHRQAIFYYTKALTHGDFGSDWSVHRALALLETRQYEQAELDVADAKRWEPDAADVWAAAGRICLAQQDWERAIVEFNRAIELDANNPFNLGYRGLARERLARWEEAAADYRAAFAIKENVWRATRLGIVLFCRLGRPLEAIPVLQRAARLDPTDREIWFQLAQAQQSVSDPGASQSYRRFLDHAQGSADAKRVQTAKRYLEQTGSTPH